MFPTGSVPVQAAPPEVLPVSKAGGQSGRYSPPLQSSRSLRPSLFMEGENAGFASAVIN
jgi:hypothetical protein